MHSLSKKSSNEDEIAHRQLDLMKNRFKNYSNDIQEQVEKNVRKNMENFQNNNNANNMKKNKNNSGGDASDLIIFTGQSKKRMQPEELDGYPDADVLLQVLKAREPLAMHRAMGVNGKLSIFGVLQPSAELQEKWKAKSEQDESAKLVAQAEQELIIPSRSEAGAAFGFGNNVQLTQMRGRRSSRRQSVTTATATSDGGGGAAAAAPTKEEMMSQIDGGDM